jgi:hypothetical protein
MQRLQRYRISPYLRRGFTLYCLCAGIAAANGEPPAGPAVADGGAEVQRKAAADAAEAERGRARNEALEARNQADLSRAAYESANKPGPVPDQAMAAFDHVVWAYDKAIDRPLASPEVIEVGAYCHLRLAGAYQYVQKCDKAVEQCKKAAQVSAGTPQEVDATYSVGLVYLQAMHDPKEALTWMMRAQGLAQTTLAGSPEQAKWVAATGEGIQRCEQEAGKK